MSSHRPRPARVRGRVALSLLQVSNLSHTYGHEPILEGVDLRLEWRQRIGIVGPNGSGKTTLLRALAGELEPTAGTILISPGVRVGYLRQEQPVGSGLTVLQEAERAHDEIISLERRLHELEHSIGGLDPHSAADALGELAMLQERFREMRGFQAAQDIRLVLSKLGFSERDLDKPTSALSGGEATRLALARLLLQSPDVLLMDEPTNHLDLNAIEWLEGFVADFGGSVLLVSHDRVFLDRVTTHIAELEKLKLTLYKGSFSHYWRQREERRKRQVEVMQRKQQEIARLDEFVRKHMGSQLTQMAKSRQKMIARLIREGGLEAPENDPKAKLKLAVSPRSGEDVAVWNDVGQEFDGRVLFKDVNLLVRIGERVGIIGANGTGKSTLIRILMGRRKPTHGSARLGVGVRAGYFAQDTVDLDLDKSVIDHIVDNFDLDIGEARSYLGRFLFSGDDAYKSVGSLSGGEKNKLVLAQLVLLNPNLLVLDEPTNHLDVASREALTEALAEYNGTLILVSHDRYLLEHVTSRTVEITATGVIDYPGTYGEYRLHQERPVVVEDIPVAKKKATPAPAPPAPAMNAHQLSKERARAKQAVTDAEAAAHEAEEAFKAVEESLWNAGPGDDINSLSHRHREAKETMEYRMAEWEQAVEHAESLGIDPLAG